MDRDKLNEVVSNLQGKALKMGMDWELDQSPMFAERNLSDLITEVVDKTNEILDELKK